ncbi:galactose-1-phosphate uridylyltransferase [Massilia cavernae]|uniref:Galactose-1-phosphate uridylyltransferase n=1 Tax=Massilia cavernae TaxID=2320864 RepID=A0A418Y5R0_9BURK|nr:galactose-1-phosphate uridylyltransferase [Massilia cavernae]RJG22249.1 galactose-1-phosphate uridylyltransferase [Massilia cavernae]
MHILELDKPDGRKLALYSRTPIDHVAGAPSPFAEPANANPHLRWHPLRGEWITYAAFRQNRTFQPPPQYNPLAVTTDPAAPTELPQGNYEIAVFDNRFPSLALDSHDPPQLTVQTAPANGKCEVVVFTQDPGSALNMLDLGRIELLFQVWADRTTRLAQTGQIKYVLPFENRGVEVGVTLHHPHGQIYAYPFMPPVPARMLSQEQAFFEKNGRPLLPDLVRKEIDAGVRMIYHGPHACAFVPACARYPYEVWVTPIGQVQDFASLDDAQRADLARALKTVLLKYEGMWQRPFPYLMAWYQAPTDGKTHPETQLHTQFSPPYRTRDRLKFLAGTELGAGMFAMDALPEEKAADLQAVNVTLED